MCFCYRHIPGNMISAKKASCLFTTKRGSDCGCSKPNWPWPIADFGRLLLMWELAQCCIFVPCLWENKSDPFLPVVVFRVSLLWNEQFVASEKRVQGFRLWDSASFQSRGCKKLCILICVIFLEIFLEDDFSGNHRKSKYAQRNWFLSSVVIWQLHLVFPVIQ